MLLMRGREQPRRRDAANLESLGHLATSVGCVRSHPAFEAHQPVVGGVLVRFTPRRDGERRVDEAIDRTTLVHYELSEVDEFGGELSDDMHSQKRLVGHPEHELHKTVREPRDSGLRVCAERRSTYLVFGSRCTCLLLSEADPSDLRDGED